MTRLLSSLRRVLIIGVVAACSKSSDQAPATATAPDSSWLRLNVDSLPHDSLGVSVRRGLAILNATHDSLPNYAPSALRCTSCHLNNARQLGAVPMYGSYGRYPQFNTRAGGVVSIEDRVNFCFTRSLGGWKIPDNSSEMRDIVAYIAFLSRGIPAGSDPATTIIKPFVAPHGDSTRGYGVFLANCSRCHGPDGKGSVIAPPLWGPKSFSIAASMAREERAAAFIKRNMPLDRPGSLTDGQAYDVAAWITSLPRVDLPEKELDYPAGKTPEDVPYRTMGHTPLRIVPVLPRRRIKEAIVRLSRSVRRP